MSFPRADLYRLSFPFIMNDVNSVVRVWLKPEVLDTDPGKILSSYTLQARGGTTHSVADYANGFRPVLEEFYNPSDANFGTPFLEAFVANTSDAIWLTTDPVTPTPTGTGVNTPGTTRTYTQRTLNGGYAMLRFTQAPTAAPFKRFYSDTFGAPVEQTLATFQLTNLGTCQCNLDGSNIFATLAATGRYNAQLQERIYNL